MKFVPALLAALLVLIQTTAYAAPPSEQLDVASLAVDQRDLSRDLRYLADPASGMGIEEVLAQPRSAWLATGAGTPNFGVTPVPHWFSLSLSNSSDHAVRKLLELSYGLLDHVDVHLVRNGELDVAAIRTGDRHPIDSRPYYHRHFLFPLELAAQEEVQVLLRVQTEGSLQLPLALWEPAAFFAHDQIGLSIQMLFVGIMLALAIYNGFLFLGTRDTSYLWYVLSMTSIAVVVLSFQGVTAQFLWPTRPELNNPTLVAAISLNVFSGSIFAYRFLDLRRHGAFVKNLVRAIAVSGAIVFALNFVLPYNLATLGASLISVFAATSLIVLGVYLWFRGSILARFYTIAWFLLLIGSVLITLSKFGILPRHLLLEHAQQIGAIAEGLLLSFALAYRMNLERKQRFLAQRELLEVQREANEVLEHRVRERTVELEAANRKLLEANAVDGLTQVKNRRFFEDMLAQEWNKSARGPNEMSLLMIDGDYFKRINDTYGHLCGDACLQHLAQIYERSVSRAGDFVARYGGEEFAVLLCHTNKHGAALVAERIRAHVAETPFEWEGQRIQITVSIGVSSCLPAPGDDMKRLVKEADEALYAAKHAGRNQVAIHQAEPLPAL